MNRKEKAHNKFQCRLETKTLFCSWTRNSTILLSYQQCRWIRSGKKQKIKLNKTPRMFLIIFTFISKTFIPYSIMYMKIIYKLLCLCNFLFDNFHSRLTFCCNFRRKVFLFIFFLGYSTHFYIIETFLLNWDLDFRE